MLLRVDNLSTYFHLDDGVLRAVDDVSFEIQKEETVALVGESGCGKSIAALSLINLVPKPGRVMGGRVLYREEDLLKAPPGRIRQIRGKEIAMIFQEPGMALNPVFTVGHQIVEVLQVHGGMTRREAEREAVTLLGETGIPEPEQRLHSYPFELSGGMQQRAMIALAISCRPRLLIADEPTTALDVTVQVEIIDLLRRLQKLHDMSILLITHDLGVVAEMANRVMVMYTGKIVEMAPTMELFERPRHPYSKGLVEAIPRLGQGDREPLKGIPGTVPDLFNLPAGCTFHPRCPLEDKECRKLSPQLMPIDYFRSSACLKHMKI